VVPTVTKSRTFFLCATKERSPESRVGVEQQPRAAAFPKQESGDEPNPQKFKAGSRNPTSKSLSKRGGGRSKQAPGIDESKL